MTDKEKEDKEFRRIVLKALRVLVRAVILLYPTKCREWEDNWEEEKSGMEEKLLEVESGLKD